MVYSLNFLLSAVLPARPGCSSSPEIKSTMCVCVCVREVQEQEQMGPDRWSREGRQLLSPGSCRKGSKTRGREGQRG